MNAMFGRNDVAIMLATATVPQVESNLGPGELNTMKNVFKLYSANCLEDEKVKYVHQNRQCIESLGETGFFLVRINSDEPKKC